MEEIVEETSHWPREKVGELLDRLSQRLGESTSELEDSWKIEVRRRVAEIESGSVEAVDGQVVSARVARLVRG
jgi:hypothetical protein